MNRKMRHKMAIKASEAWENPEEKRWLRRHFRQTPARRRRHARMEWLDYLRKGPPNLSGVTWTNYTSEYTSISKEEFLAKAREASKATFLPIEMSNR